MKTNFKHLAIFAFLGIALFSCSSDDDNAIFLPNSSAPEISNFEYGEGSAHSTDPIAYKGSDIHLEAEIYAENVISSISVDIHAHDLEAGPGETPWDFEQTFNDANYQVINADFHEHIDIPNNIPAGEYHITLTVVDALGNSTEIEGHIDILEPISLTDISIDATVQRGSEIHAEFMVNAIHGIHNITVDIHAHGLTVGAGEIEWDFENVYTDGYHGLTEVEFHNHIDVPATAPAGEYHALFTVEDEEGNTFEYETHIDVTE
ncbi:DUF4625 domain-containing protein [Corallibacter sp.]|uniref:DUF4625 domain-containing protein n=1 Tax=Corallibacter sp. TaxID=2038084 RepID=UPI003AB8CD9F